MAIRRQGFEWQVRDLGQLPVKRLEELSNSPQSIFISGIGNATITKRNCTANDEFLVLQYTGSSPGIWPNSGNNWKPRGYINFVVETTAYFVNPDGLPAEGMPGSALPYPITTAFSPVITDYIPIEIPPDTNWDITYFLGNSLVEPIETFPVPFNYSFNTNGTESAPILTYPSGDQELTLGSFGSIIPVISGGDPDTVSISPALPAGLTIQNADGAIEGTPTATSAVQTYTVTATNTAGSTNSSVDLGVVGNPPIYTYLGSPYVLTKDVSTINAVPTKLGGPDATSFQIFSGGALPDQLTFDTTTGLISGPVFETWPNTFYTILVEGPLGNGSTNFRIEVVGNLPVTSYPSPQTLLTDQNVSISPTNTGGPVSSYVVWSGALPSGLSLDSTTGVISGIASALYPTATVQIRSSNGDGDDFANISFTVDAGVPIFEYESIDAIENVAISAPAGVPQTGFSPITSYALTFGFPPSGISIDTSTGVISGTAPFGSAAPYDFEITATGPGGTPPAVPVSITVNPGVPNFGYTTPATVSEGFPYTDFPIQLGGAPSEYTLTSGSLPDGLGLNTVTGEISGVCLDPVGTVRNFKITGSNLAGSFEDTIQITTEA
jgi:hypothetical protein